MATTWISKIKSGNTTYNIALEKDQVDASFDVDANKILKHKNSVSAKDTYPSEATTASANGGQIVIRDIQYDAQGHVTNSTDRTITLSQTTYSLSGLGGIGTVTASGTSPLSLNTTKSGTTLTITGSVAKATSSSAGIVTVGSNITVNSSGVISLSSTNVTNALGFTPYSSTNPNGYTTNTGTVTKVTAGSGLSIGTTSGGNFTTSGTINHTNSVTAQTTQALYPIEIDAQGHISGYGTAITSLPASDVSDWAKATSKPSYALSEITGADDVKAIEALTGTSGLLKKTAANTWSLDTNTYATETYVNNAFATNDAMIFKGTIAGGTSSPGTYTSAADRGHTYKVSKAGYINGIHVEVGDMFICTDDNTAAATSSTYSTVNSKWTVVQTNLDGAVIGPASSTANHIAIFGDTTGKVIIDSGFTIGKSVPSDAVFTDTNKYHKTGSWNGLTYTASAVNSADELKFTLPLGTTSATGVVQLSSATNSSATNVAATPSAVKAAYDLAASKLSSFTETDPTVPSWAKAASKPSYTADEVGAATSSHVHGNLTNDGKITTTATIASGDKLVIVDSDSTAANKITGSSITFGDSTTTFLSNKGTWATPAGTYSLPLAASGTRGGIQIGYSESGTNYAVKLSSEKAYVTVPWTDTKVTQAAATTAAGAYPVILAYSTATTAVTNTVNKTSTLTYNPSTKALSTGGTVNGYTLAAASAKAVDTSIAAASTSTNLPTSQAVASFVEGKGYSTTDTKNTAGATADTNKLFIIGAKTQEANPQTYSNSAVYEQAGTLAATTIKIAEQVSLIFNSTTNALDFVFA